MKEQTASDFEIVVIVDGDDTGPSEIPGVRIIRVAKGGPGHARNLGVDATHRQLILFLGDDIIPEPTLVEKHLQGHDRHPESESAVLGLSKWHPEIPRNRVMRWMEDSGVQFDYSNIQGDDAGWGRFYSSNVSLKREFFLDVGGFDEDFEYDYEDLDFAYRAHERGMKLWYQPDAVGQHLHLYDLQRLISRYGSHAVGERMMCEKHPWFTAFFAEKVAEADRHPPVSPAWLLVGDHTPARFAGLRSRAKKLTSVWFHQQVSDAFHSAWEGQEDLDELRAYLGDQFDITQLWSHRDAVEHEMETLGDEALFYRSSRTYLYDLTAFAMWDTKRPYRRVLKQVVAPNASLLDYGCGIGTDGLRLLLDGFRVSFADYANPSTEYLRWRLARRGQDAPVYDLDDQVPSGFDAAYSFDVIEHVPDPFGFLGELERRAAIVVVNLLEEEEDDIHIHHPLPVRKILDRAQAKGLLYYRVYNERSHLVAYRSSANGRVSSRIRRFSGTVARAAEPIAGKCRRAILK